MKANACSNRRLVLALSSAPAAARAPSWHFLRATLFTAAVALTASCAGSNDGRNLPIRPQGAVAVTDKAALSRFSLERVLGHLAAQSAVPGLVPSAIDPNLDLTGYLPVALFNRPELASADRSHCGEYRIVYEKAEARASLGESRILILEAALPNPLPRLGMKSCRSVARFWRELAAESDVTLRAERLERFYFRGLPPYGPLLRLDNFAYDPVRSEQARTNHFIHSGARLWHLRPLDERRSHVSAARFVPRR